MTYLYEFTSWLRLNSAKVSPFGDDGDVQIYDETTVRCRRLEGMLRWKDRIWEKRKSWLGRFGRRCMRGGIWGELKRREELEVLICRRIM